MSEIFTKYIANEEHYSEVIERIAKVRDTLWIGTADIKDLYVTQNGEAIPLLGQIAGLLKRGVTRALPPRPFQDGDFRPGSSLHRICQFDRRRHRHEERIEAKLRSRHPHQRPTNRRSRHQPV